MLLLVTPLVTALAVGVAWLGAGQSAAAGPLPLLVACALASLGVQWLAFLPAAALRTERFYDLTGSLTTLALLALALAGAGRPPDAAGLALAAFAAIWALRLGSFLALRIRRDGKDGRFDAIKTEPLRFLNAWSLQGLWVFLNLLGVLVVLTRAEPGAPSLTAALPGLALAAAGFALEVVADHQKSRFKASPEGEGRFIDQGLWAWSRHPNYLGEILFWTGMFLACAPGLQGGQWVALLSPLFVTLLLTRVSGVPLLEARADARWGGQPDYEDYKRRVPVLLPWPRGAQAQGRSGQDTGAR